MLCQQIKIYKFIKSKSARTTNQSHIQDMLLNFHLSNIISGMCRNILEILTKKKIILHLVDHSNRISSPTVIFSKYTEVIIKNIFNSWKQVHGAAEKFMSDYGGEFTNGTFWDICESMNITLISTAAESPSNSELVEWHNLFSNTVFDLALSWCVNAKNSLANVHEFSPFQFALGQNP